MSPLLSSSFLPLSSVNSPSLAPGNTLHLAVLGLARQVLCTGAPHHRTSKLSPALGVAFLVPSAPDTFLSLDAVWPRQVCEFAAHFAHLSAKLVASICRLELDLLHRSRLASLRATDQLQVALVAVQLNDTVAPTLLLQSQLCLCFCLRLRLRLRSASALHLFRSFRVSRPACLPASSRSPRHGTCRLAADGLH
ncbi:hypothetical protein CCHR01_12863 [Colletotrichum chrysophilum]|uniref:Uncharacterized protein n=1 Tax=Colletotrichum chrysophilum TaxID=1836956 RepID=A0AAD9AFF0_9PEZI|nr:hypothetical protein CCHR01_12863 [Colletotrichum chrysophilum]